MAGFSDFMGAMRFGMGLVSGFTHQAQQERQANETQQLALLKILKDQEHDVVPIDPSEVQQSGGVLGALFGAGGGNTFNIGGRGFKVVPKAPYVAPPSITNTLIPQTLQTGQRTSEIYQATPPQPSDIITDIPGSTQQTSEGIKGAAAALKNYKALPAETQSRINAAIDQAIAQYPDISKAEVHAFISRENPQYNPQARSPAGAVGLMQLMPGTAERHQVEDSTNIEENIRGGVAEISRLKKVYPNNFDHVLAAYNAGEGAVNQYKGIPPYPETQRYVPAVKDALNYYTRLGQSSTQQENQSQTPPTTLATPQTAAGLRYAQNAPSVTDINPAVSEPALPRTAAAKVNAQGLDDDQLSSIRATLAASEAQYRAVEAQITLPRQRQALTAANSARLVVERDKLVRDAVQANRDVVMKERKVLGDMYHMPIPDWVRTPSTVASFHELMSNFDPDMHASEVKRLVTQRIAQAVQTGDQAKIQETIPVLTARMAARHFSKADIDEVKEVGGYKAWEAGQQTTARQKAEQPYKNIGTAEQQDIRQFIFKKWVDNKQIDPATPINSMPFTFEEDVRKETTKRDIEAQATKHAATVVPELTLEHLLDPTTLRPLRNKVGITWGELTKLPNTPLAVAPIDQKAIQALETFKAYANAIQADLNRLTGPGGPFASVTQDWAGRNASAWTALVQQQTQKDPAFKRLQERLNEWGTKTIAALEGLGSRPAARLLEPALAYRPSMEANFAGRISGGLVGKIPDTPDQIRAQVDGTLAVADNIVNIILYGKTGQAPAAQAPAAQAPAAQAPAAQAPAAQQTPASQRFTPTQNQYFDPGKP